MKLDPKALRFLSRDDFRTLVAVEMGMKNHEFVPVPLIQTIANLKFGGCKKAINTLHKFKLLFHDSRKYDGYKLTYLGYDFLALKAMVSRETISYVGNQIGVGKESDIYIVANDDNEEFVLKLHRLGRVSFKTIKNNRDYLRHRKNASWLYLSRLAALKEFSYMKALYDNGFPVPKPIDYNRHCIVMDRVKGYPLTQIMQLRHPSRVYSDLMALIVRLATYGLIHGDFNEFNILINDHEEITLIDFPQMVSTSHYNAEMYFDRDVQCIRTYFEKRFDFIGSHWPKLSEIRNDFNLDVQIAASGFTKNLEKDFVDLNKENNSDSDDSDFDDDLENNNKDDQDDDEEEEEEDEEEEEEENEEDFSSDESIEIKLKDNSNNLIPGLPANRNREFRFIKEETNIGEKQDTLEEPPQPIMLRREYLQEMNILEGGKQTIEEIENNEELETTISEQDRISKQEQIKREKQQQMVQERVKKQLSKSGNGKQSTRNTIKSRSKKEIKNHISGGY